MIIKPYIHRPKLSTLKIGDTIKWSKLSILDKDRLNLEGANIDINNPYTTIKEIYHSIVTKDTLINGWFYNRFEVEK